MITWAHLRAINLDYWRLCKRTFKPKKLSNSSTLGTGELRNEPERITHVLDQIPAFPGLQTLIRVKSERQVHRATIIEVSTETRYYIASFIDTASAFAERIRGYWGVENKVHYVRDVTQAEDASRIRTRPLVHSWALARNFALNLYRDKGFDNMAQAQRLSGFGLSTLMSLFRMK